MKNLKFKLYLNISDHTKRISIWNFCSFISNILSVVIPLEVKNIIDQLQNDFSSNFVILNLYG